MHLNKSRGQEYDGANTIFNWYVHNTSNGVGLLITWIIKNKLQQDDFYCVVHNERASGGIYGYATVHDDFYWLL